MSDLKKDKFYLTESQLLNYCSSTSLLPPGSSFMPQVSLPCFLQKTSETMMEKLVSLRSTLDFPQGGNPKWCAT